MASNFGAARKCFGASVQPILALSETAALLDLARSRCAIGPSVHLPS
jgi:hypothetical protein